MKRKCLPGRTHRTRIRLSLPFRVPGGEAPPRAGGANARRGRQSAPGGARAFQNTGRLLPLTGARVHFRKLKGRSRMPERTVPPAPSSHFLSCFLKMSVKSKNSTLFDRRQQCRFSAMLSKAGHICGFARDLMHQFLSKPAILTVLPFPHSQGAKQTGKMSVKTS